MSAPTQSYIYRGFWVDWNDGKFRGSSLTVSNRSGALLQAFTAVFTTFVLAQLWSIIAFTLHHARSRTDPVDGLRHQRQAILRNAEPFTAASFFAQQAFSWRGRAQRAVSRSICWTTVALCYSAAAIIASTFTGYAATKSSRNRLVISDNCGYATYASDNDSVDLRAYTPGFYNGFVDLQAYTLGFANDAVLAASQARACYNDDSDGLDQCRRYIKPRISWTGTYNTTCPFESGICSNGDRASFTLTTEPIDSLSGLGINSPPTDRLVLQKRMTCSSIREVNYYDQEGTLVYYNFGPVGLFNYTFVYNRRAKGALISYTLKSTYSYVGLPSPWSPVKALNRTDADVSMVFISSNTVIYAYPNDDPVFAATKTDDGIFYNADYDMSTIACAEQYQVCNPMVTAPDNNVANCSSWMGAYQLLRQTAYLQSDPAVANITTISPSVPLWKKNEAHLSTRQVAILGRIAEVLPRTSTYNAISTRRASAVRLQDTLYEFVQTKPLSNDYWTFEIGWWFDACLARLQQGVMEFAVGPSNITGNNRTTLLADEETRKLCQNQLTRDIGDGSVNFSTYALVIIYAIGLTIICISIFIDQLGRYVFTKIWKMKAYKGNMWNEDGFLPLHRRAFVTAVKTRMLVNGSINNRTNGLRWTSGTIPVTSRRGNVRHFGLTSPTP